MKRDYTPLLKAGNAAQIEKLEMNGHKDDWKDMSFYEIRELIHEEFREVYDEMTGGCTDFKDLRLECADLKNACNFMICLCDKELKA